jgi:hypothetical protein
MPSAEYDLSYLETAVELLEDYLLAKEIYWKMSAISPPGEPGFPALTLGGVLLAVARVSGRRLTTSQDQRRSKLINEIDRIQMKWRTAWRNRAKDEYRSRLDLWRNFLEEFREDPNGNFDRYGYEVNRRVMLHLLAEDIADIPISQLELLAGLDRILKGLMVPGEFVWADELKEGFPPESFPYLYLTLRV